MTVAPVEEQGEWDSRRLWNGVAKGIREGDFDSAAKEKSRIEVRFIIATPRGNDDVWFQNEQRQRRRDEAAAGTTWGLKHFEHIDEDPTC